MTWERYKNILGVDTKKIREWKRMCVGVFNPLMLHPFRAAQHKKNIDYSTVVGFLFLNWGSFQTTNPQTHTTHAHISHPPWFNLILRGAGERRAAQRLWAHVWLRFSFLWRRRSAVCLSGELLRIGCWHLVAGLNTSLCVRVRVCMTRSLNIYCKSLMSDLFPLC